MYEAVLLWGDYTATTSEIRPAGAPGARLCTQLAPFGPCYSCRQNCRKYSGAIIRGESGRALLAHAAAVLTLRPPREGSTSAGARAAAAWCSQDPVRAGAHVRSGRTLPR